MCVGSMCNGDPLPVVYQWTTPMSAVTLYPVANAAAPTYPVIHTFVTGTNVAKLHNCPSCHCISVTP